jgi:hypothetical protein
LCMAMLFFHKSFIIIFIIVSLAKFSSLNVAKKYQMKR